MHDPDRQIFPEGSIAQTFGDQSSDFFEKIIKVAPSILYVFDLTEMRNIWVNRSMFLGLGYTADEVAEYGSDLLQTLMHPDDLARYPAHFERLRHLETDEVARFEYRMKGKDGSWHWLVSDEMAFTFAEDGTITQIVGSAHDVSDARNREDRINLLVREMNHRIKNLFSVIMSMITLTSKTKRDAPSADMIDAILGRVNALSVSQSLSLAEDSDSLTCAMELTKSILQPFTLDDDIKITGVGAKLRTEQATSFAMILHELGTNAVKYGALSVEGGRLNVVLDIDGENLTLDWIETTTFEVTHTGTEPTQGFGTRLVQRSIAQIQGEAELDWQKSGLRAKLRIPLSKT